MNLKRLSAILLALAMTASVAAFAAESETPDVVVDESVVRDVNHDQGDISLLAAPAGGGFGGGFGGLAIPITTTSAPTHYTTTITINGEPLEEYTYEKTIPGWGSDLITVQLTDLPPVEAGYVPLRAIAQSEAGGLAHWDPANRRSYFNVGRHRVYTNFSSRTVTLGVDGEEVVLEGLVPILHNGTTYVPITLFDHLEGFWYEDLSEGGVESYAIYTPNYTPILRLASAVTKAADLHAVEKTDMETLIAVYGEEYGFSAEMMTECYAEFPGSYNSDTIILVKLTDESKREEIQAAFEAFQAHMLERSKWGYLTGSTPVVENYKIAFEGDWALFLMTENADEGVAQFHIKAQEIDAEAAEADGGIMVLPSFPAMPML